MLEGIRLSKFKKMEKQSVFLLLALLMCILVGGFTIYSIIFIGSSLDDALTAPPPSAPTVKFDIQGFENLKLIR